ncbi:hypothetical protein [Bradyrhizobium sp. RP6]|uniref:hypothetical protein n=1 Tax=Bradyrhizobium sp. RP6 TaxID=2489596 RepID=UPI0013151532|nr:hypothetical protein [Bradyrhizobium sp. RP6]
MVAALIMARGYNASRFHGQEQIGSVGRQDAARATAGCRTRDGRMRTDVIGPPWNFDQQ